MEDTFPYKWERGRRFDIQSSNTLRRKRIQEKPDTIQVSTSERPLRSAGLHHSEDLSLDKRKRWEILEEEKAKGDIRIVEELPERSGVFINGKRTNLPGRHTQHAQWRITAKTDATDATDANANQNPDKKVSRSSRRKQEQRYVSADNLAKERYCEDGQIILHVQRNRPDYKYQAEKQRHYSPYRPEFKEPKARRLELQKQVQDLYNGHG